MAHLVVGAVWTSVLPSSSQSHCMSRIPRRLTWYFEVVYPELSSIFDEFLQKPRAPRGREAPEIHREEVYRRRSTHPTAPSHHPWPLSTVMES